jgi:hypothetical protein
MSNASGEIPAMTSSTTPVMPSGSSRPSAAVRLVRIVLVVVLALAAVAALGLLVPWQRDTSTREVPATAVRRLVVRVDGSVSVRAAQDDAAQARVTTTRRWSWVLPPTVTTEVTSSGDLTVTGHCAALSPRCQTEADAVVPAGTDVVVDTAAGTVTVTSMSGAVDVRTSAGAVTVQGLTGTTRLRSSAGSIDGELSSADVQATTSAGSIALRLTGVVQQLAATTSAGSVDLTVPDDVYRVEATTSAGRTDVQVRTDPASTHRITARTSAGSIVIRRNP